MDATDAIARRFPLIARPRPGCTRLDARVDRLGNLAQQAARDSDPTGASAVYNQAALLASDVGLPELARQWCHQHAAAYLSAHPLSGRAARRGLEPVVNLARLHIRDGDGDAAHELLEGLFEAVSSRTDIVIGELTVPAATLTGGEEDHREVHQWLWTVLLADGTRALATAGRWQEAHEHLTRHNGIGQRMLDGRQIAILSRAIAGDTATALGFLGESIPTESWEQAVAACLAVLCLRQAKLPTDTATTRMCEQYLALPLAPGRQVFRTRLGLAVINLAAGTDLLGTARVTSCLVGEAITAADGYVARDVLADEGCRATLTDSEQQALVSTVDSAGLGLGTIPNLLMPGLLSAVRTSETVIAAAMNASGARRHASA